MVVANPGATPEAPYAASALAAARLLGRYHAPVMPTPAQLRRLERMLPGSLARPALRELRRRELPATIPAERARSIATASNLARVAMKRSSMRHLPRAAVNRWATTRFDRAVASALRHHDAALFAFAGAALHSTAAARRLGIRSIVSCPLGHHAYVREMMREEARLQPQWAGTLQGHEIRDVELDAHARELAAADRVFAVSRFSAETLRAHGVDEDKIEVTHLGVDTRLFRPGSRPPDDKFRVIFVGQITQRKGLSYLIEGFERAGLPNSELVLLGSIIGDPKPWAGRAGVTHVAPLPRAELTSHYHRADVYVLPSLVEGFPLTAAEAMACGLPVIVSTNTFADDVITDGVDGFIVPIRDADAIAERLRVLAAAPELRARIGAAARRTAERFDWGAYRDRVVELTRTMLAGSVGHDLRASRLVNHPAERTGRRVKR